MWLNILTSYKKEVIPRKTCLNSKKAKSFINQWQPRRTELNLLTWSRAINCRLINGIFNYSVELLCSTAKLCDVLTVHLELDDNRCPPHLPVSGIRLDIFFAFRAGYESYMRPVIVELENFCDAYQSWNINFVKCILKWKKLFK